MRDQWCRESDWFDVRSLQTFRTADDVKLNLLVFLQRLEAGGLDRGEMRKQVRTTTLWGDEAEALCIIEPLDSTRCHAISFQWVTFDDPG